MVVACQCLIPLWPLVCVFRRETHYRYLERKEEQLSRAKSRCRKNKWVLSVSLSLVTQFYEDREQSYKEKVRNIQWKGRFVGLVVIFVWLVRFLNPHISARESASIKPWVFVFSKVWALRLSMTCLWLQFFSYHTTELLLVQITGQVSAGEGQLKDLDFVFARGYWVVSCASGMLAFVSGNQYCHQHNTTDSLSSGICRHPAVWVAERLSIVRSYPSKLSIATSVNIFFKADNI